MKNNNSKSLISAIAAGDPGKLHELIREEKGERYVIRDFLDHLMLSEEALHDPNLEIVFADTDHSRKVFEIVCDHEIEIERTGQRSFAHSSEGYQLHQQKIDELETMKQRIRTEGISFLYNEGYSRDWTESLNNENSK